MQENKPPLNLNKLASLEVTLVRNYNPLSYSLKGVRSRATNVAKNSLKLSEYGKGTFFYFTHILNIQRAARGLVSVCKYHKEISCKPPIRRPKGMYHDMYSGRRPLRILAKGP